MKKKLWDEKKYTDILKEVGEGRYKIFNPDDPFISYLSPGLFDKYEYKFNCVCLATSTTIATATVDYKCEGFLIPKHSQVVLWRNFRYCTHDGSPHLNADDNIIFPDQSGDVWKVSKTDAYDHYVAIASWAGLQTITSVYHLPDQPCGLYPQYIEKGANVPVKFVKVESDKP
ncbi:MAG: hypothetical protein M0R48_07250 [Candidatus Omnitrophica bacterium]|jgi:hypothetical protein|nr:hypothetical protein [Candidatus Omnitrophota bacterium]